MGYRGEGTPLADGVPVTVPRDAARDAAHEELRKAVYHQHDPGLVDRAIDWVERQLDDLFDHLGSPFGGGSGGTALVLLVLFAVLVTAALWWRYGAPGRAARSTAALFTADGPRTADQHRADAAAHAARGAWTEAVREQMRALVRGLEERTLLDPRPGRTADEAAAEAGRSLPAHAEQLTAAARLFDDIAYGDRAADETAYRTLADLDRALRSARPTPVPAGGGTA